MASPVPVIDDVSFDDLMNDPYPIYARARKMGSVVRVTAANIALVTRFDDIVEIERDPETYSSVNPASLVNKVMGHTLMRKDGADHADERKAMEPALRPGTATRCWAPKFEAICDELIEAIRPDGEADLFDAFAAPMAARGLDALLGFGGVDWRRLAHWSQSLMDGAGNYSGDPAIAREAAQSAREIEETIARMLPQHRAAPNDSVLSAMVRAGQSIEQIHANIKVAVGGGLNEPRDAILTLVLGLLESPDQLAAVKADPALWGPAFEEAVRWISPIGMYPRRVARPVTLGGADLEQDQQIGLCVAAANHDPARFADPARFDILRPKQSHLAFGAGAHFCAGTWVARVMVSKLAVPRLFERLPNLRIVDPAGVRIRGWVFRGPTALPVAWDR
jgi:cytochrome P450